MVDIAYQRIAANRPAVTTEAELYAVQSGEEIVANLTVVNQSAASVDISVAHTDTVGAAAGEDWLAFEEPLAAYSRLVIPIVAKNPETIRIKAGTVDVVSFVLTGMVRSL